MQTVVDVAVAAVVAETLFSIVLVHVDAPCAELTRSLLHLS